MFTLWLPPKVWLHGSQSTITGRSAARNGHTCRIICWLAASIRCVLSTPLGVPVEPEVNRIFAIAVRRPGRRRPPATAGPGAVASRSASRSAPGRAARGHDRGHRAGRVQRGREPAGVLGEHRARAGSAR